MKAAMLRLRCRAAARAWDALEGLSCRWGCLYAVHHTWVCLLLGQSFEVRGGVLTWSSGAARRLRLPVRIALALFRWGKPAIRRRWAAEQRSVACRAMHLGEVA